MAPHTPPPNPLSRDDGFQRPAPGWYALLQPPIAATALLAGSQRAYDWVRGRVPLPSRGTIQAIAVGTIAVHLLEAGIAYRTAQRLGRRRSARRWAAEAFVVGFPVLLKLHSVGPVTSADALTVAPSADR